MHVPATTYRSAAFSPALWLVYARDGTLCLAVPCTCPWQLPFVNCLYTQWFFLCYACQHTGEKRKASPMPCLARPDFSVLSGRHSDSGPDDGMSQPCASLALCRQTLPFGCLGSQPSYKEKPPSPSPSLSSLSEDSLCLNSDRSSVREEMNVDLMVFRQAFTFGSQHGQHAGTPKSCSTPPGTLDHTLTAACLACLPSPAACLQHAWQQHAAGRRVWQKHCLQLFSP